MGEEDIPEVRVIKSSNIMIKYLCVFEPCDAFLRPTHAPWVLTETRVRLMLRTALTIIRSEWEKGKKIYLIILKRDSLCIGELSYEKWRHHPFTK